MVVGVLLGQFVPSTSTVLNATTFVDVSVPIAVSHPSIRLYASETPQIGLLVMMWPILCRISFASLRLVFKDRKIWYHLAFVSRPSSSNVCSSIAVHRRELDRCSAYHARPRLGLLARP
jgi:ACR3 family arsenite efflux pump ArsB